MSVLRYTATKDNTISSAFKVNLSNRGTLSNMGSSDILEVFAIFGQASSASLEQSRVLVQFPVDSILTDRTSGKLPESGSVTFKLKMFNAEHNQTVPEKVTCVARPLVKAWTEGGGLDMESLLDEGASNWLSASSGTPWVNPGGDFLSASYISTGSMIPLSYEQFLDTGLENLDIDITELVEEYIKNEAGTGTPSIGSVIFSDGNNPTTGDKIKIYAYNGDFNTFEFKNTSGSSGTTFFVEIGANARETATNFINTINVSSSIKDYIAATGQDNDLTASLTQRVSTLYGNTVISSSTTAPTTSITDFSGGTGALNYGLILKLSGSQEDGSLLRSYYTKKFFARSSHHFLEKPVIEAQWDSSITDDRGSVVKASPLASEADNLNNIYLYNRIRGSLKDIPNTGSRLLVQLVPGLGQDPESVILSNDTVDTYITASKHSTGVYKATFAYSGSQSSLRDVWMYTGSAGNTKLELFSGSSFSVSSNSLNSYKEIPRYVTKITNLKSAYNSQETATFRVYTRNKNWKPNVYTVARQAAPIDTIREAYYKIKRVSDDMTVINYSTSSIRSYSSLSYDISGSYFDLDMSILEPNYLYEISLLFKDGSDYTEQKEKFKFRVDP